MIPIFFRSIATLALVASLGQVHRARLRDGRPVAVKVQRPGIREQILEDLEAYKEVAELVDEHAEEGSQPLAETVEEFRKALMDPEQQAQALESMDVQPTEAVLEALNAAIDSLNNLAQSETLGGDINAVA